MELNYDRSICPYLMKGRGEAGRGGEGFLRRRHLPKILTFLWKDRQTDIVVHREVTLPKICFSRNLSRSRLILNSIPFFILVKAYICIPGFFSLVFYFPYFVSKFHILKKIVKHKYSMYFKRTLSTDLIYNSGVH